jgi:hypothetical protein
VESWRQQTRILEALYRPILNNAANGAGADSAVVADIVSVAKHYSIPLSLFSEVGGSDPDYLDANGFVKDARWRNRPAAGELVVASVAGQKLTIPRAAISWKLTEQAVQYAQLLCTRDGVETLRGLPDHLQPPRQLTDDLSIGPVITYGGRILRDLLDLCHGSPECAAQALATNSTDASVRLEVGVRRTALYARRTLHHIGATARSTIGHRYAARK